VNNPSDGAGDSPDDDSADGAPRGGPLDRWPLDAGPLGHRGRVVLVTGGTRGIGRHIVTRYAQAGATVVACGRTDPDAGEAAGRTGPGPGEASSGRPPVPDSGRPLAEGDRPGGFVACDVREPAQVEAMVDGIVERWGRLDVVVNNAGGAPQVDSATASARFNERVVALNLLAPFTVAQAANRVMQAQAEGGSIVNVASVSGTRPSPGSAAYGAAKAGLLNLTQTLAVEWAPRVRVNAVVAGIIATEAVHLHYGDERAVARVAATVPAGRMGTPDDVAAACLFLSSPLAPFVTGAALAIHGGNERPAFLGAVADA
jgi:NAD(P)-dependent dehydrogenase (short-subunit alcohol dehydrogenase family)